MTLVKDDKMAGEPRLDVRRITVLHVVTAFNDFGEVKAVAEQLRISVDEVTDAIDYAENPPEQIDAIREEWDELATVTAGREEWGGSTPVDAGESLFSPGPEGDIADMPDLGKTPLPDCDDEDT
jgi:uncharacterized protein (DUF433 family)